MSTKTLRKRIALVAVATLGAGVLSVAPANAAAGSIAVTAAAAGVNTSGVCAATAATSVTSPRVLTVGGTQTITYTAQTSSGTAYTYLVLSGPAKWISSVSGAVSADQQTIYQASELTAGANVLQVTGAGSIQVAMYETATSAAATKFYLSGVASCTAGLSTSKSYVQVVRAADAYLTQAQWEAIQADAGADATTGAVTSPVLTRSADTNIDNSSSNANPGLDTSLDEATVFANDATAHVAIRLRDAYSVTNATAGTLGVACTNNAVVAGAKGGYYSAAFTAVTTTSITIAQATSGTSMSTTCTFQFNGVTMATKTIKFLGDVKSITLANYKNGNYDAATTSGYLVYYLKDAAGNKVGTNLVTSYNSGTVYSAPTITSGAKTLVTNSVTSSIIPTGDDWNPTNAGAAGVMSYNCLKYGKSAITVYTVNAAGEIITSNAADLVCGGDVESYSASFDKASYNTGDIATLTITGKADDGGSLGYAVAHGGTIAVAGMTAVTAPVSTDKSFKNTSTWTYTYTVNQTAGSFAASVNIPVSSTSAQYNKPLTITYKIVDPGSGVSNADVLKAIVSLIASINKQIAALQKALLKK